MNRNDLAVKGSFIGITSQIVNLVIKFAIRTFSIKIFGKEILGLDSVLLDMVNMLSLAELGITSAMIFRLYVPVINKDEKKINVLLATYRIIYHGIAVIITVLGLFMSCFLPYIVTGLTVSWSQIYIAFFLQLASTVSSYLIAYQRVLLNADQKKHLCMLADLAASFIFGIVKIIFIVAFRSYLLYLTVSVLQMASANLILYIYAKHQYSYMDKHTTPSRNDLKTVLQDGKEVLFNKLAGYVYSSTDNLIVSIFLGTNTVGLLSNYKYISSSLRNMVTSTMASMQPLIGHYLNSNTSPEQSYNTLKKYTFIRYIFAGCTIVPFIVLADTFVLLWTGSDDYLMDFMIPVLLALDYYIGCVYGPLGEYIIGLGYFKQGKYPTLAGALINLVFSVFGVKYWKCHGILFATVISQIVIWIGDGIIVFVVYFKSNNKYISQYIITHFAYIVVLLTSATGSMVCVKNIPTDNLWIKFMTGVLCSEAIFLVCLILTHYRTDEFVYLKRLLKKIIQRKC